MRNVVWYLSYGQCKHLDFADLGAYMTGDFFSIEDDSGEFELTKDLTNPNPEIPTVPHKTETNIDNTSNKLPSTGKKGFLVRPSGSRKILGPYLGRELLSAIKKGEITKKDLIRRENSKNWHYVSEIPELEKAIRKFSRLQEEEIETFDDSNTGVDYDLDFTQQLEAPILAATEEPIDSEKPSHLRSLKLIGIVVAVSILVIGVVVSLTMFNTASDDAASQKEMLSERDQEFLVLQSASNSGSIIELTTSLAKLAKNPTATNPKDEEWQGQLRNIEKTLERQIVEYVPQKLGPEYEYVASLSSDQYFDIEKMRAGLSSIENTISWLSLQFEIFEKLDLHRLEIHKTRGSLDSNMNSALELTSTLLITYLENTGRTIINSSDSEEFDINAVLRMASGIPGWLAKHNNASLRDWALQFNRVILGNIAPVILTSVSLHMNEILNFTLATKYAVENLPAEKLTNIGQEISVGALLHEGMWREALVDQLTKQFARIHSLGSDYDPHESAIWIEKIGDNEQVSELILKLHGASPNFEGSEVYLVVVEMEKNWESIEKYLDPFIDLPVLYRIASEKAEGSSFESDIVTSPTQIMSQVQSLAKSIENMCQYDPNPPKITINWTKKEVRVQNDRELRVGVQLLATVDSDNKNIAWIPLDGLVINTGSVGWKPLNAQQLLALSKTSEDIDIETEGLLVDFMVKSRNGALAWYISQLELERLNATTRSKVNEAEKLYEQDKNFCLLTEMTSEDIKFNKSPWGMISDRLPAVVNELNNGVPPVINIKRWLERYRNE